MHPSMDISIYLESRTAGKKASGALARTSDGAIGFTEIVDFPYPRSSLINRSLVFGALWHLISPRAPYINPVLKFICYCCFEMGNLKVFMILHSVIARIVADSIPKVMGISLIYEIINV